MNEETEEIHEEVRVVKHRREKGSGSVSKTKEGKFRAFIDSNGSRNSRTFETAKDAKIWLKETIQRTEEGMKISTVNMTFQALASLWINNKKGECAERTVESYEYILDTYLLPKLRGRRVSDIGTIHIQKVLNDARNQIKTDISIKNAKNINSTRKTPQTGDRAIQLIWVVMNMIMIYARRLRIISYNPMSDDAVKKPEFDNSTKKSTVWSIEEIEKFLNASVDSNYYLMFLLVIITGIRQAEALGLEWSKVDFDKNTIHIDQQLQYIKGKGLQITDHTKSKNGERYLILPDSYMIQLKEFYKIHQQLVKNKKKVNTLIFTSSEYTPVFQTNMIREFKSYIKKAEVTNIRFHDLRHTAISYMVNDLNIPVADVIKVSGHTSEAFMMTHYVHSTNDENKARAVSEMDKMIKKP